MSELNTADKSDHERSERHASWAELFFDLVAAAGVSTLAYVLRFELDAAALGLYALLFLAFWLSWTTFMIYGNVAAGQTHVLRLMIGMFGLGVMAASVPGVARTVLGDSTGVRPLTARGCDAIQGYLLAEPMPADALRNHLEGSAPVGH